MSWRNAVVWLSMDLLKQRSKIVVSIQIAHVIRHKPAIALHRSDTLTGLKRLKHCPVLRLIVSWESFLPSEGDTLDLPPTQKGNLHKSGIQNVQMPNLVDISNKSVAAQKVKGQDPV